MATPSGATWQTWCKLLMRSSMGTKRQEQALLRILHNVNYYIDVDHREETLDSLIELLGVEWVTELQLQRGYWMSTKSCNYLLDKIRGNESH